MDPRPFGQQRIRAARVRLRLNSDPTSTPGTLPWRTLPAQCGQCGPKPHNPRSCRTASATLTVPVPVHMFYNADTFNQDISNWNTAKVDNMGSMFKNASSFNQNISNWNTSKVTKMLDLFRGASAFNQNISNWDTSSATSMSKMFENATSFNQIISICLANFWLKNSIFFP